MGFFSALIVTIVGILLVMLVGIIPDSTVNIIPLCWIPGVNCQASICNIKLYTVVILLAIIVLILP